MSIRCPCPVHGLALVVLLLSGLASPGAAAESGELQAAAAFGRRFVEAVNSGDAATRLAVVREVFAAQTVAARGEEGLVGLLERLAKDFGTLEFHHAEGVAHSVGGSVRRSLHVFARSGADGRWRDFQFQLDPAPPHRFAQLVFIADVAEPVYLPNGAITDPSTLTWLNAWVDRLVAEDDLSGALLVAVGDRAIVERYFGWADSVRTVPCSQETRFNLGSGNKMFTALAAAILVNEGRLAWDTPVGRLFPEVGDAAWRERVTLGHLLSHTAGVGEYWTEATDLPLRSTASPREVFPFIARAGIRFAPGEGVEYSNSNFILAGLVIEETLGESYYDFVRERIYDPCGMTSTDSYRTDVPTPHLAVPLTGAPRAWVPARRALRGTSAGGGYSTARDMLRFSRRLVEGGIVPPAVLAEMTRSHTDHVPGADLDYGYGFIRERSADRVSSFGHGGIARGVNFEYRHFPAADITLIAFSNQDNGAYDSLRKTVTRLITGER